LKSYYWEPQTKQIPFQRDGSADIRKEIKSKFCELASCLKVKKSTQPGSSAMKAKRAYEILVSFIFSPWTLKGQCNFIFLPFDVARP
jgi:hypothetical protein